MEIRLLITVFVLQMVKTKAVRWKYENSYLLAYADTGGTYIFDSLQEAQHHCLIRQGCGGITYWHSNSRFTLRRGTEPIVSPSNEISWIWRETGELTTYKTFKNLLVESYHGY
ncbi:hypothetical protein ACHWQZ_G005035 [Mnemiopsis leidyi]